MKAIIVGGGVGGLTTALMLTERGIACEVYEQASEIRELGVGINTLPHAIKELAGLGLLPRLDDVAIRTHELIYTNRFGQEIWREPRGVEAASTCRNSPSIAAACRRSSTRPCAPASARAASSPATGSAPSSRTRAVSPPGSSTARAAMSAPPPATC